VQEIVDALAGEHAALRDRLAGLSPADWARPSQCAGWSIADVVLHMAQTDELAGGSASGDLAGGAAQAGWDLTTLGNDGPVDSDVIADAAVVTGRGMDPAELLARYTNAADRMCTALRACDPRAPLTWVVGRLPARTLATTRLAECWIHAGDIGYALGIEPEPSERLWHIARLAWRTLPYAFTKAGRALHGPVALLLTAPDGSTWHFDHDEPADTVVQGDAHAFCLLAARRVGPAESGLKAVGPDADAVLELVRTFA
jgi:uncharacterized protein (TIGR03084 family)